MRRLNRLSAFSLFQTQGGGEKQESNRGKTGLNRLSAFSLFQTTYRKLQGGARQAV